MGFRLENIDISGKGKQEILKEYSSFVKSDLSSDRTFSWLLGCNCEEYCKCDSDCGCDGVATVRGNTCWTHNCDCDNYCHCE